MTSRTLALSLLAVALTACSGSSGGSSTDAVESPSPMASPFFSPNPANDAAVAKLKECAAAHTEANAAKATQGVSAYMRTIQPCESLADWVAGANATNSELISADPARTVRSICAMLDEAGQKLPLCVEAAAAP